MPIIGYHTDPSPRSPPTVNTYEAVTDFKVTDIWHEANGKIEVWAALRRIVINTRISIQTLFEMIFYLRQTSGWWKTKLFDEWLDPSRLGLRKCIKRHIGDRIPNGS
jgi:hypothetical protein